MKKLLLAILLAAILVGPMASPVLAAPARTMTGQMTVWATGRDLDIAPINLTTLSVTGTVYYAGIVTSVSSESTDSKGKGWETLAGADIEAVENVDYVTDGAGNVLQGEVNGTLTIKGADRNPLVFTYHANVQGNIFVGPAGDLGTWKVADASGSFNNLKKGHGTWAASVQYNGTTFVGTASVSGTY